MTKRCWLGVQMVTLFLTASGAWGASPTHTQIDAAAWQTITTTKHKETGPIEIARSEVAGVDCFRGSTTVSDAPADALLETARDIVGAVRWSSAGLTDAKMIARSGDRQTYYQFLDVPNWTLASDRFWILEGEVERSARSVAFRWDRVTAAGEPLRAKVLEEHPGAVEPPINVGGWFFESTEDSVHIRYVICSDSGGSMPRMLQNTATRKALPDTIGDVVREARRVARTTRKE